MLLFFQIIPIQGIINSIINSIIKLKEVHISISNTKIIMLANKSKL